MIFDSVRFVWLLVFAVCSCVLGQPNVPKWSTYEVDLTASGSSPNWYTDPNAGVTATFSGPGGNQPNAWRLLGR